MFSPDDVDEVCLMVRYEYVIRDFAKDKNLLSIAYAFDIVHEDVLILLSELS